MTAERLLALFAAIFCAPFAASYPINRWRRV